MTALLEARGLTKRFGGVVALDGLDLAVTAGEILGLIGPNGSGKTTFFNVVTGIYGADAGSVTFDGADITRVAARAIYQAGISRTFQRSRLSLPLSIFDNIMIGNHKRLQSGALVQSRQARRLQARIRGELSRGARAGRSVRAGARRTACSSRSPACR